MELTYIISFLFLFMNKIYTRIFILFLFSGLIYSAQQVGKIEMENNENKMMNESLGQQINEQEQVQEQLGNQTQEQTGEQIQEQEQEQTQNKNGEQNQSQQKEMVKEQVKVMKKDGNCTQFQAGNVTANTQMNMVQEENKIKVQLSNGKNAEVKIMPDVASETAMERLRIKVCSEENNCTIELKETGQGEQVQAMYEVKAEKKVKLFGFLDTKMQVKAQVSAENGEVIREERPWWSFLAIEEDE